MDIWQIDEMYEENEFWQVFLCKYDSIGIPNKYLMHFVYFILCCRIIDVNKQPTHPNCYQNNQHHHNYHQHYHRHHHHKQQQQQQNTARHIKIQLNEVERTDILNWNTKEKSNFHTCALNGFWCVQRRLTIDNFIK